MSASDQAAQLASNNSATNDPLPNPEPSVPSLPGPDPGVFHHQTVAPQTQPTQPINPPTKS